MSNDFEAVVIGASAGALDALSNILPALPRGYPLPVIIVVHLPPDKKSILAELMRTKCSMNVHEAEDKDAIEPGTIYFAPPDYHLLIEDKKNFALSSDEPDLFSRPSINILFESAAHVFGSKLFGIILTGANEDGARGLRAIVAAGGNAIIQQPEQAHAATMPLAAQMACPTSKTLSLDEIGLYLRQIGKT